MSQPAPLNVEAGNVLFRQGDSCAGFVQVHSGAVRVVMQASNGREMVLYYVRPGEICMQTFACLTQNKEYAAEGVADTDCQITIIPKDRFHSLMRDDAEFRDAVYASIAERFSDFEHAVQSLAFSPLNARLAEALLRLSETSDTIQATHERLASEIGSSREVVSRQLSAFAQQGVISLSRGQVHILDRDALSQILNGSA